MTLKKRRKHKAWYLIPLLLGVFLFAVVANVVLYNDSVQVREEMERVQGIVRKLRVENAQLKNSLYDSTDSETLVSAAERLGLVKENNPTYLSVRKNARIGATEGTIHVTINR